MSELLTTSVDKINFTNEIRVIKKDGTHESYDAEKIKNAIRKASNRAMHKLNEEQINQITQMVFISILGLQKKEVEVPEIHNAVESVLENVSKEVAESYRDYRNYKQDFVRMLDKVYQESQKIMYIGDKDNANSDSTLVSTKRSLIYNALSKELYKKFFLTKEELQAIKDGYIYIHDISARLNSTNCCLLDVTNILKDGFEMGNVRYTEPKTLDVAFDVISDVVMSAAAQQYGGLTVPEVDKILEPYAHKSLKIYVEKYMELGIEEDKAYKQALKDIERDFEQGFQGWEMKWNTVGSSRGDYPFISVSFGLSTTDFGKMANKVILKVRQNGQGSKDHKKPVLFPKLIFLYDENVHGEGKELEETFNQAIECSKKAMYPDYVSLSGPNYVSEMYQKYKTPISPMGCRSFLSPWYERGGFTPADEKDKPIYVGRGNCGVVSLNLPMMYMKAKQECEDFYEVLDYYLELIRNLHKRTIDYLGEMKASTNPLAYCEGGFYGGHLKPDDKIKPVLKTFTTSFGITALNELQQLYNAKSIAEDGEFALQVLTYIANKVDEFKKQDGILHSVYGSPAESLCLDGNELVQTVDGNKKLKDIKIGDLVYSYNLQKKELELKPVLFSQMTRKNADVVKITFDNGQELICTPDHPIGVRKMVQNKQIHRFEKEITEFVPAILLKEGDRIRSNYIKVDNTGRTYFSCGKEKLRHRVNAKYKFGELPNGYEVHHINEDKLDDSLNNLQLMTSSEHRNIHGNLISYRFTSETCLGVLNHFYGKTHTEENKMKFRLQKIKDSIKVFNLNGEYIKSYDCAEDAMRDGNTRNCVVKACRGEYRGTTGHQFKNHLWYYANDCKDMLETNHKVVKVERLEETMDVYDIQVADNHNFFVGGDNGILVHNCGTQVKQFRMKYGIIENVSDKDYMTNSFHCHVSEDITPIEKQDLEGRFIDLCKGGQIYFTRFNCNYNTEAFKTIVRRGMKKGFYEGTNLNLSYCEECGHEELDMTVCPKCGSTNITSINRVCGYLGYSRIKGDTRFNEGKMAEVKERVSY